MSENLEEKKDSAEILENEKIEKELQNDVVSEKDAKIEEKHAEQVKLDEMDKKMNKFAFWGYILFFIPMFYKNKTDCVKRAINQGFIINLTNVVLILLTTLLYFGFKNTNLPQALVVTCFIFFFFTTFALLYMLLLRISMIVYTLTNRKVDSKYLDVFKIIK